MSQSSSDRFEEDDWLGGNFRPEERLNMTPGSIIHRDSTGFHGTFDQRRRRSWANLSREDNMPPPLLSYRSRESSALHLATLSPGRRERWSGSFVSSPKAYHHLDGEAEADRDWGGRELGCDTPSRDSYGENSVIDSPMDTWEEEERRAQRRRSGRMHTRRHSCDSFDFDEVEEARMRIRHAAWAVVDAQQKLDMDKIAPTAAAASSTSQRPASSRHQPSTGAKSPYPIPGHALTGPARIAPSVSPLFYSQGATGKCEPGGPSSTGLGSKQVKKSKKSFLKRLFTPRQWGAVNFRPQVST